MGRRVPIYKGQGKDSLATEFWLCHKLIGSYCFKLLFLSKFLYFFDKIKQIVASEPINDIAPIFG